MVEAARKISLYLYQWLRNNPKAKIRGRENPFSFAARHLLTVSTLCPA